MVHRRWLGVIEELSMLAPTAGVAQGASVGSDGKMLKEGGTMALRSKKLPGTLVGEDRIYFGIMGPDDRFPIALWEERRFAKAALDGAGGARGLRIVRTHVRIHVLEGRTARRPPRAAH